MNQSRLSNLRIIHTIMFLTDIMTAERVPRDEVCNVSSGSKWKKAFTINGKCFYKQT